MDYIQTTPFKKQIRKLRLSSKLIKSILHEFDNMDSKQVRQYPYYKAGIYKMFKKYRIGRYRIFFTYCKECYNKYRHYLNCSFCDENNLELIVLFDIQKRSFDYR